MGRVAEELHGLVRNCVALTFGDEWEIIFSFLLSSAYLGDFCPTGDALAGELMTGFRIVLEAVDG